MNLMIWVYSGYPDTCVKTIKESVTGMVWRVKDYNETKKKKVKGLSVQNLYHHPCQIENKTVNEITLH